MAGPAVSPAMFGARQAQPLDHSMADAREMLAGLFDKPNAKDLPPFARAALEQTARVRSIAARLFAPGSDGEELLEALCDTTLRRPTFVTQLGVPSDQVLAVGQFREGMAATIYLLLAWIAEGRSEQPPQREGDVHVTQRRGRSRRRRPAAAAGPATAAAKRKR